MSSFGLSFIVFAGIGVLVPQAAGAGNDLIVGRYLQLGLIFYSIMAIPGIVLWVFIIDKAILCFGFDEETAVIGKEYAYTLLVYLFVQGVVECFTEFLNKLDHERYATIFTIIFSGIESGVIILLVVLGVKDIVVVGLAQVAVSCLACLVNLGVIAYKGWLDDYWEGFFRTNGLKDGRAVHTVLITAFPLGLAWLLTYGEVSLGAV
jgi:Na+-driven multidrug efflux pump